MTHSSSNRFFLVIPCFREGRRLEAFLEPLCRLISALAVEVEIQVMDDGSGAQEQRVTKEIVDRLRAQYVFLRAAILLPQNLGKGGTIYAAWDARVDELERPAKETAGEWLAFADADGATSPEEICRLLEDISRCPDRADVWLASRVKMLGREVERTVKRHIMGRVYATLATWCTGLAVYDSQCGCKALRFDFYPAVRRQLRDQRFGFDMELLAWLDRAGARMVEYPVDWRDIPGSKVHLFRDSWRMFVSLLRLRSRLRQAVAS